MKFKDWFKKNWKETLYGGFVLYIVYKLLDQLWNGLVDVVTADTFLEKVKMLFQAKIIIPFWLATLIIALLLVAFMPIIIKFIRRKNDKNSQTKTLNKGSEVIKIEFQSPESFKPTKADRSFNQTLDSKFLDKENGIFSIWAYVSDVHNEYSKRNMYIISYATKKGVPQKTPGYATYPNAWAICRMRPNESNSKGVWRFWCNNVRTEQTKIECADIISGGWHLFSVAWSKKSNYIKFVIDNKEIGQREFVNWPSDFSEIVRVGTWPTQSDVHYFESKIGPHRFVQNEFDVKIIEGYLKMKPE